MQIKPAKVEELLGLVRRRFPDWDGFDHEAFLKDEVEYKQKTVAQARELLSPDELAKLIEKPDFDEFIDRLRRIAAGTNLLYMSTPRTSDLSVLFADDLDKGQLCRAIFDLLHGPEPVEERFNRYISHLETNSLPNKWTFPTYFLFMCHPETEIFVKPKATKQFLGLLDPEAKLSPKANGASYAMVRDMAAALREALTEFRPRDMIDVQGFIWVCSGEAEAGGVPTEQKRGEFEGLYGEFLEEYLTKEAGRNHLELLGSTRAQGRENFEQVVGKADAGSDVTDDVLIKLLPYVDTEANRSRDAWVSIASALAGDVKIKFEGAKWASPEDWREVARALLAFFRHCNERPEEVRAACDEFATSPHSKGLKQGMLSPMLNALHPERFPIVNNKSRKVINHFAGTTYKLGIRNYADIAGTEKKLVGALAKTIGRAGTVEASSVDLFDVFCHWLVAVKKYFDEVQYWKIAPGEQAEQWDECLEESCILIGWDDLGDISGLSKAEFDERRDAVHETHPDWSKAGMNQVWTFANQIKKGDRVVANRGTGEVVGIGTVAGDYYFEPEAWRRHRRKVTWDDTLPREIDEGGWKKTIVKLSESKFNEIVLPRECPFSQRTFELLAALNEEPTQAFYAAHKQEFAEHVEEPFKSVLLEVVKELPAPITERMETEKRLFSRIPKNDFGRGGAWPFFWGALYTKGGKRIEDAQLSLYIDPAALECGFYIGDYGSEQRQRFLRNCVANVGSLVKVLAGTLEGDDLLFGVQPSEQGRGSSPQRPGVTWKQWLRSPGQYGIDVSLRLGKAEALSRSKAALTEEIKRTYLRLFPLVLLAISSDPMRDIAEYLNGDPPPPPPNPPYSIVECAEETGFGESMLQRWLRALERKKQAIIYGPPGTGKTYLAERLAKHLVGGNDGLLEIVQFHPSYAYEDFIQGIRPKASADGKLEYPLVPGRFLEFCREAKRRSGPCVLIIDEINRANLSRVFGELMYLLEYRESKAPLAGGGMLSIPANVRIIGTMNTADRSIALVDHALRRRFAFLYLPPDFEVLRRFHHDSKGFSVDGLIQALEMANRQIDDPHYALGTSFFLRRDLAEGIEDIWRMEIEPYLEEYFFDQPEKLEDLRWQKVSKTILG